MITVVHLITKLELGGAQENTLYTCRRLDRRRFRVVLMFGPGGLLDEDAFSIQVVTASGALRAFAKQGPEEIVRSAQSLMPAYDTSRLSEAALEDLLAYLGTLRGAQMRP